MLYRPYLYIVSVSHLLLNWQILSVIAAEIIVEETPMPCVDAVGRSTIFRSRIICAVVGILCSSEIGLVWHWFGFWLASVYLVTQPPIWLLQVNHISDT